MQAGKRRPLSWSSAATVPVVSGPDHRPRWQPPFASMASRVSSTGGPPGLDWLDEHPVTDSTLEMAGSMNALCLSPDQTRMVVAGRDVLKVIKLRGADDGLELELNMRVGKMTMTMCSNDVAWHHINPNEIATAATNGHVVLWDLNLGGEQKRRAIIHGHTRTANSLRYHPTDPWGLLTGSQDLFVRRWDTRNTKEAVLAFKAFAPVRQVACNPTNPNQFAAALENGVVQIWDMRNDKQCWDKIMAHQGPAYTVEWHPTERGRLASGGRDKSVRIWSVQQSTTDKKENLVCGIKTIASVARVCWRPDHTHQLASCSLVHDSSIHVWDLRRQHVPVLSFSAHKNVVTGFQFDPSGSSYMLSCSKDQKLLRQTVEHAHCPIHDAAQRSSGIAWNPNGELGHFSISAQRHSGTEVVDFDDEDSTTPSTGMAAHSVSPRSDLRVVRPFGAPNLVKELATRYRYRIPGDGVVAVCDYNADVCDGMNEPQLAMAWRVVGDLFEATQPSQSTDSSAALADSEQDDPELKNNLPKSAMFQSEVEELTLGTAFDLTDLDIAVPEEPDLKSEAVTERLAFTSSEDEDEEDGDEGDDDDDDDDDDGDAVGGVARGKTSAKKVTETPKKKNAQPFMTSRSAPEMAWDLGSVVSDTIMYYGDHGDVQTCVAMMLVLGEAACKDVPVPRQLDWFHTYVELLDRMGLPNQRAEVICASHLGEIKDLNNVAVHLGCGTCTKPLGGQDRSGFFCAEKCNTLVGRCSICRLPVKGYYVWCQGCGHGGHLDHMREWFAKTKACPTGCGHICEFA